MAIKMIFDEKRSQLRDIVLYIFKKKLYKFHAILPAKLCLKLQG